MRDRVEAAGPAGLPLLAACLNIGSFYGGERRNVASHVSFGRYVELHVSCHIWGLGIRRGERLKLPLQRRRSWLQATSHSLGVNLCFPCFESEERVNHLKLTKRI